MRVSRRGFSRLAGASALTWGLAAGSRALFGQGRPRAVVIGGGAGGATAAHHIARDSAGAIDVALIEPKQRYTTCFFSNLYLGGYRSFESITHGYDKLASAYGIRLVQTVADTIDRDRTEVVLADGSRVGYDRLVVAPGIDLVYDSVPGYSKEAAEIMPHAWQGGPQTLLLKRRLDAIEDGETIVMLTPPNPYRCPPGPYERVSMMAHQLTATGRTGCRIVILDPKDKFSKQGLFSEGWEKYYPGMIQWLSPQVHGGIEGVDAAASTVLTDFDDFHGALVNVIPPQRAGAIAVRAGLADETGWCPVDPVTMQSTIAADIHVIGDAASAGAMPKSAFSANSQAMVAADHVRAALTGSTAAPARYANACWSLIETDDAVMVGGTYAPRDGAIAQVDGTISRPDDDPALRKQGALEAAGWYDGIIEDMFG
jgi:NADPH-dependent 2,4-dienoyl-CoA reductase/sulfur reductase-like enzyme